MKSIDSIENRDTVPPEYDQYFVVLRSGRRVSEDDHVSRDSAEAEKEYWDNILRKWPDGSKMTIHTCQNANFKENS